jgi:hypothetical protein
LTFIAVVHFTKVLSRGEIITSIHMPQQCFHQHSNRAAVAKTEVKAKAISDDTAQKSDILHVSTATPTQEIQKSCTPH